MDEKNTNFVDNYEKYKFRRQLRKIDWDSVIKNTKPKKGVIAMACGGKKSGGKKPPKKK